MSEEKKDHQEEQGQEQKQQAPTPPQNQESQPQEAQEDQNVQQDHPKPPETSAETPKTAPSASSSVNLPPNATGVVWRLQYVPTVVYGDGTSAPSIPNGFPVSVPVSSATSTSAANAPGVNATAAASPITSDASAAGKPKDGETIPVSFVGQPPPPTATGDGQQLPPPPLHQVATMVQIQTPEGQTPPAIPSHAYLVAPPNFAASIGAVPGQNITITLPPTPGPKHPQARVSHDPNNAFFTLDLSEDNTDLPLPLEEEVDLSSYNYKINLGKDVVSGKGGKVQQLNRHFRNMVAAAYPTYDSTTSKISKRKIGLKIYQAVIDRGGRFLDIDGNAMDRPKSILKVMKALKDAKTWTSDAKRQAKRKREEARLTGEKEPKKQVSEPLKEPPNASDVKIEDIPMEIPESVANEVTNDSKTEGQETKSTCEPKNHSEVNASAGASTAATASSLPETTGQTPSNEAANTKEEIPAAGETVSTANENDTNSTEVNQSVAAKEAPAGEAAADKELVVDTICKEETVDIEPDQATLAAAAAAAAVATLEATEGENSNCDIPIVSDNQQQTGSEQQLTGDEQGQDGKKSQAVMQGLQLLTKAAANAQDTNAQPNSVNL